MKTLTILDFFLLEIIFFAISFSSLSLEAILVACSWAIARIRASFTSSSWKCSLIMEAMTWSLWASFPSSSWKFSLIMESMTRYLSHASHWNCPILDWRLDIVSVWLSFFWRRYLDFLIIFVTVRSLIATPAAVSSSSLVSLWGLSGVAFDTLMVFTWATGDFLFFPVFVLQNFFFFLGGILFFGLEGN